MFINEKDNIGIRGIEESDLEFLKDQRNHPSTWSNLTSINMLTSHGQKNWLLNMGKDSTKLYFLVFEPSTDNKIGFVRCDEIDNLNQSIRIGADIHMKYRGQGHGTKLYHLLLDYCFNYLNMNRIWLITLSTNSAAMSLYKKMGFKKEGIMRELIYRKGRFNNCCIMSILKKEYINEGLIGYNDVSM